MTIKTSLLAFCMLALPTLAHTQDRSALNTAFDIWLESTIWPRAAKSGISRATFDASLNDVGLNFDLPDLVYDGAPTDTGHYQAEFRPPSRYFSGNDLGHTASQGRTLMSQHASTLRAIEQRTGVPAQIIVAIWGRESSFGQAATPNNAFQILGTKGFLSTRAGYFTDELIAALQIVERGFATPSQMKSSWAGALGQPQFMPSNYLAYAADGDGDGRANIWTSQADTLASIGTYLQNHGWQAGHDWGFEVTLPAQISCTLEGPDQGKTIADWADLGVTRVNGNPFPENELLADGYLMLPAGRYGPAFIVTPNFYVLKDYNESDVYALFVGHVGDKMKFGVGPFQTAWQPIDGLSRQETFDLQTRLVARGYDVGGVDGLIGYKTRRAVGQWQAQAGIDAKCYPNRETLRVIQLE